jgi:phage-related protein
MRAKGKLSGEEMRQLTEAGVPAWEMLAEAMGKTTAEIMDMQSKGLIPVDRAIKMLVEGMNKRFPDMMKNMENTWEGVTSTIKDVWRMTIGAVTQNLFQGVVSWLQGVRDFAVGFYDTFQKYGLQRAVSESFGPEVAAVVSVLGATLRGLASVVSAVTGFITQYGKQIRFVAVVMGTYLVLLKAVTLAKWLATVATTALTNSQLLLAGQSSATTGIIGFLSNVITFYKVQMLGAAATSNIFTAALMRVRAALIAVHTALGPIGWVVLAITGLVTAGMALWNKYTQSLQRTASTGMGDFRKAEEGLAASAGDSSKALDDQTKALNKAGKAAQKNLQPFDEINQLQKESAAGSGAGLPDMPTVGDLGGFGGAGLGGLGIDDVLAGIEAAKPTLSGFWKWIMSGVGKFWKKIKKASKKGWDNVKKNFSSAWKAATNDASRIWSNITSFFAGVWDTIAGAAARGWDNVKKNTSQTWGDLRNDATRVWGSIKAFFADTWQQIRSGAADGWDSIKLNLSGTWSTLKADAASVWSSIKSTISNAWDSIRTNTSSLWSSITSNVTSAWNNIRSSASSAWSNLGSTISNGWDSIRTGTTNVWNNISASVSGVWNGLKSSASSVWSSITSSITSKWNSLKSSASSIWQGIRNTISSRLSSIKSLFNFSWSLPKIKLPRFTVTWNKSGTLANVGKFLGLPGIPKLSVTWLAKGGLITAPMLAGLGEAGREAVIPLDTNTGWADIMADRLVSALQRTQGAGAGVGGDVYVYIGNEQVDAYIYRSQDRRNIRSNGR